MPDAAEVKYWYNNRDLPIFMQDGNLLASNQRICTYHDSYGRVNMTGFVSHASPPTGNDPQPASADLLTQTNYHSSGRGEGQVSYTKSRVLGTSNYLDTYFYYDSYGRPSYNRGDNHLYSYTYAERTDFTYDFADNILAQDRDHRISYYGNNTIDEDFTYDHWGRPTNHDHKINTNPTVRIANNVYDHRSRLKQKNLHQTAAGGYLQNVDYTYNEQDWLTKINEFQCMAPVSGGGQQSAQAPTGEGFEIEVGYGPTLDGGGIGDGGSISQYTIRITGQVGTDEVLAERVYALKPQPDSTYLSDLQQVDYASVETPFKATFSLTDEKVTHDRLSTLLQDIEDKMMEKFEADGMDGRMSVTMANVLQAELEQAWQPISVGGFWEAEEAAGGIMMAAGSGSSDDLFAMLLYYDAPNSTLGATAQKNGNIAYMGWQVGCNDPAYYGMQYDHLDRIKKATYADLDKTTNAYKNLNRYSLHWVDYDVRGNIMGLTRKGWRGGTNYSYIDWLYPRYFAGTNTLEKVYESSSPDYLNNGFKSISGGYQYYTHDVNGNQTSDPHRGISTIEYNHLNLPKKVIWSNGNWVEWTYDANGTKLKKTTSAGATHHYLNGVEYDGTTVEAIYHIAGQYVQVRIHIA